MYKFPQFKRLALATAIAVSLAACGNSDKEHEKSKEEVQFLSHMDQARFYQKQGQLRASIEEAQNALKLNPNSRAPYEIVADDLLIAGDARNAEKQFTALLEPVNGKAPEIADSEFNHAIIGLATAQGMQKHLEEARATLAKLKSPSKDDQATALLLQGDMLVSEEKYADAKDAYAKAKALAPSNVKPLVALSRLSAIQNDMDQAQALIKEAEKVNANDSELWLWKAQLAESQQHYQQAEEAYVKALDDIGRYDLMTFKKYQTISRLIAVLRAQGKVSEAFAYEEILSKSAPGAIKAGYDAALKLYKDHKYNEAAAELEKVLAQAPGHTESGILLGMIRYAQGDMQEAEKYLSKYSEEGTNPVVRKMLAATKIKLQRPEEATQILRKLDNQDSDPEILSLLGIASLASGETEEGLRQINKALELNPNNFELRMRLARYYVGINQPEKAIDQLQTVIDKDKTNDEAKTLLTSVYVKMGNIAKAESFAKSWLKESPKNTSALNALGSLALQKGSDTEARQYFEQAAAASPSNPLPLINLASIEARKKDWSAAQAGFEKALQADPENLIAIQGLLKSAQQQGDIAVGAKVLADIATAAPKAVNPRLTLAEFYASQGDIAKAEEQLQQVVTNAPEDRRVDKFQTSIYRIAVEKQLADKNYEKARELAQKGQSKYPDDIQIGLTAAKVEFVSGNADRGLEVIKKLKEQHKDAAAPLEVEGDYYASKGDFAKAVESYRAAWNLQNSQSLAIKMHESLMRLNKTQDSLQPLKDWLTIQPNSPQAMTLLAMGYQANNQFDKAIEQYEQIRKIRPNDAVALNNLAWLYQQTGNPTAESTAAEAYKLSPQNAAVADTYGWILFKNNKVKESLDILEQAHKLDPSTAEIAGHLADAYDKAGEADKAKAIRATIPPKSTN